jgi:ATP-dependent RNA helicase RhlE
MLFKDLLLIEPLLRALETEGYERPTPIQEQAIPPVLQRRDLLGCAQTGTGKTAAFALPILQILHAERVAGGDANSNKGGQSGGKRPIRSLILTPTRELAIQIGESFTAYGRNAGVRNLVIFGGVGQTPQTDALRRGTDVLIATPGRLLDLMNQGFVSLRDIGIFVLDEADRMLDMGFIHDVKKVIAKLPTKRQTLFFSATMPPEIAKLSDSILTDPIKVAVTPVASTAEKVAQKVFFVDKKDKKLLLAHLLKDKSIISALVFTRTKHGANKVVGDLTKAGFRAEAIHGNKSQNARQAALSNFKNGKIRVLVATDIAARGIDIEDLSHVINFELPNIPETYVHRIGRTGRAGASGIALSFCESEEVPYLKDIQKLTGQLVPVEREHPFAADLASPGLPEPRSTKKQPAPVTKTPAVQRPDTIPLPERRPDTHRQAQAKRPEQPLREDDGNLVGGDTNNGRHNRRDNNGSRANYGRQDNKRRRDNDWRNNDRRDNGNEQRGEQSQPSRQPRNERPARFRDERDNGRSQQRSQQKPAAKPSASEVAATMRNRFASILEVSSIEKQDRPQKPKPNYRDREDKGSNNRNGDNRPSFNGDKKKKRW